MFYILKKAHQKRGWSHWQARERFGAGVAEERRLLPWRTELTRRLEKRQ